MQNWWSCFKIPPRIEIICPLGTANSPCSLTFPMMNKKHSFLRNNNFIFSLNSCSTPPLAHFACFPTAAFKYLGVFSKDSCSSLQHDRAHRPHSLFTHKPACSIFLQHAHPNGAPALAAHDPCIWPVSSYKGSQLELTASIAHEQSGAYVLCLLIPMQLEN